MTEKAPGGMLGSGSLVHPVEQWREVVVVVVVEEEEWMVLSSW